MSSEKKAFRGKFGGYNKKDVNNYIAEENKRFTKMRDEMQKALEESEKHLNTLHDEVDKQKETVSELIAKSEEKDRLIEDYKENLDSKDRQIGELEKRIAELSAEKDDEIFTAETIEEKDARIAELEAVIAQMKAETKEAPSLQETVVVDDALLDKARSFDSLSAKIDDILDYAKREAQRIIKVAEKTAGEIEMRRTADVNKVKQSISARSASIIEDIRRAVKGSKRS